MVAGSSPGLIPSLPSLWSPLPPQTSATCSIPWLQGSRTEDLAKSLLALVPSCEAVGAGPRLTHPPLPWPTLPHPALGFVHMLNPGHGASSSGHGIRLQGVRLSGSGSWPFSGRCRPLAHPAAPINFGPCCHFHSPHCPWYPLLPPAPCLFPPLPWGSAASIPTSPSRA